MPRLLVLVPMLVLLVACNQGREAYVNTRSTPTSSEDSYSMASQLTWDSNRRQGYELPAQAPDRKGAAPAREGCIRPGPQLKSTSMVAWSLKPVRATGSEETPEIVGTKIDKPLGNTVALRSHPLLSTRAQINQPGIGQSAYRVQTGSGDLRPRSSTGAGTTERSADPLVNYNDRYNPYCEHEEGQGVLPVDPLPLDEK